MYFLTDDRVSGLVFGLRDSNLHFENSRKFLSFVSLQLFYFIIQINI